MDAKSPHILNTSANLLGFCLVVLTSIRISRFNASTMIDEVTGIAAILLMASCLLSFLSLRTNRLKASEKLEQFASLVFLLALFCLSGTILLVSFNVLPHTVAMN